jgi:ribonucleoside-diphosphate reductase alpha chain
MVDEAFLLGLYQSDGTQHRDNIMIDIWENDFDLVDEINNKFEKVFYKYGCNVYNNTNQYGAKFTKEIQAPKLRDCVVNQSEVKKKRLSSNALKKSLSFEKGYIPAWIWESDEETQWSYVRGLLYADGTVFKSNSGGNPIQISYVDINKDFLKELQKLFNNLGLQSSIRLLRKEGKTLMPDGKGGHKYYDTKDCFRLIVGNKNDALTIEKNTGFLSRKGIELEDKQYRDNTKKAYKVIAIEYVGNEDVYCPTVYTDEHIFTCNGMLTFNCSEICLPSTENESFVCCLASMNLASYDEWKNTDAVKVAIYILEAVMSEFIRKASKLDGMEDAVRFAIRHRALGLGTLGEHTFLQERKIPFISLMADNYRRSIYSRIKKQAEEASIELADMFGACEVNIESNIHKRHTTLLAVAPTTTNALISGDVSPGIEPWVSNIFQRKVAKGSFLKKNPTLERLLRDKEQDTAEVWDSIVANFGSVQHLDFLTDEEKEVFLTAYEINQYGIIKAASLRQDYICQSQSLNLFVLPNTPAQFRSELYLTAYYYGVKTLYYQRSLSNLREGQNQETVREYFNKTVEKAFDTNCISCEG